jgi:tRNA/rRNA methyltransferase
MALAQGRKGPAKGGILDGAEAELLRELLAGQGDARVSSEHAPVRGLARLLRRNPTDAERALWEALVKDRRFAGRFKRQVPVGPHIADFVSFPLRTSIEIVPVSESEGGTKSRATKRSWFVARGYRVIDVVDREIEADVAGVLDRLAAELAMKPLDTEE